MGGGNAFVIKKNQTQNPSRNSGGCILLFTWFSKAHFSSVLKWIRLHFCPCVCVANILGAAIFHSSLLVVP